MTEIELLLPADVYDALYGANSPSAGNTFVTFADLAGAGIYGGSGSLTAGTTTVTGLVADTLVFSGSTTKMSYVSGTDSVVFGSGFSPTGFEAASGVGSYYATAGTKAYSASYKFGTDAYLQHTLYDLAFATDEAGLIMQPSAGGGNFTAATLYHWEYGTGNYYGFQANVFGERILSQSAGLNKLSALDAASGLTFLSGSGGTGYIGVVNQTGFINWMGASWPATDGNGIYDGSGSLQAGTTTVTMPAASELLFDGGGFTIRGSGDINLFNTDYTNASTGIGAAATTTDKLNINSNGKTFGLNIVGNGSAGFSTTLIANATVANGTNRAGEFHARTVNVGSGGTNGSNTGVIGLAYNAQGASGMNIGVYGGTNSVFQIGQANDIGVMAYNGNSAGTTATKSTAFYGHNAQTNTATKYGAHFRLTGNQATGTGYGAKIDVASDIAGGILYGTHIDVGGDAVNTYGNYTIINGAGQNHYGLYLDVQGGTSTNYGIWQAQAASDNVLKGDTGIGTSILNGKLTVRGADNLATTRMATFESLNGQDRFSMQNDGQSARGVGQPAIITGGFASILRTSGYAFGHGIYASNATTTALIVSASGNTPKGLFVQGQSSGAGVNYGVYSDNKATAGTQNVGVYGFGWRGSQYSIGVDGLVGGNSSVAASIYVAAVRGSASDAQNSLQYGGRFAAQWNNNLGTYTKNVIGVYGIGITQNADGATSSGTGIGGQFLTAGNNGSGLNMAINVPLTGNNGNVVFGADVSSANKTMVEVTGDVEIIGAGGGNGIILESPDGTRWRATMTDLGAWNIAAA